MRAVIALVIALVAAGCVNTPIDPAGTVTLDVVDVSSAVFAHRADGTVIDPTSLPGPIASALYGVGALGVEPTIGVDADGVLFMATVAPFFGVQSAPTVMRSMDLGMTWEDVSPTAGPLYMPPTTNDPFLYVDPDTGRVFQFAMEPILVCAVLSWSDDKGESWITNPRGCGNTPPWDHQAMVAAHPTAGVATVGYPNVLIQCVNQFVASNCARSLDGGLVWLPLPPVFVSNDCGGLHGHPVAAPDGTIYLPKMDCGVPSVGISTDSGMTWTNVVASEIKGHPWPDPAMAVDADGNVFMAFVDEVGAMLLTYSTDVGQTWSEPVVASPAGLTTHIPALAAGDAGHVVIAYPGTSDLPKGYESSDAEAEAAGWHGYLTIVTDALAPNATFITARATPADDPLVRGICGPERCPGMVDFIDVVIGPDGRPYAAFVDVCEDGCGGAGGKNKGNQAVVATLTAGPLLWKAATEQGSA